MSPAEQAAADLEALRTVRARLAAEAEQQETNARVCRTAAETARDAWGEARSRAAELEYLEAAKVLRSQEAALVRAMAVLERGDVLVQETCALVARAKALELPTNAIGTGPGEALQRDDRGLYDFTPQTEAEPAFAGAGTIDFGGVCVTCHKPERECQCPVVSQVVFPSQDTQEG